MDKVGFILLNEKPLQDREMDCHGGKPDREQVTENKFSPYG